MKEIKLDCNPKYTIREDGVVISYMYNKPRVMKTYKNKHGADIVDIRVNGKYKHVHIKTLIEQYFPKPIPDGLNLSLVTGIGFMLILKVKYCLKVLILLIIKEEEY